ncbi:N-acyl-D-amino-acid deacylase [Pseudarthrobacter sp. PvP004]|uniref:N-acyl-D-amino-acid deacylase family protein n=1 Tax=Pseudarthrobacter sp. PvP004 TaxID=2817850 RepID=UPI001AE9E089|nr:amidohydrolase family protein [Pseudarthrobacter sp. PvP004]MBP2269153.1 N-acyl-D-amino-acid deacylase [Pseudarthrobacter sp. PvP004]
MLDVLIQGGLLYDGTGAEGAFFDVGVLNGKITIVAPNIEMPAQRTIDAGGLIVTPGLIDPHSHSDWSILANRYAFSTLHQGVTTEVVGNCGVTYGPLTEQSVPATENDLTNIGYRGTVTWRSFGELLETVHGKGTSQNLAWLVGHTALRTAAFHIVSDDPAKDADTVMKALLREAMESGAIGFSTGLEYGSGRFSQTDELMGLNRVCGSYDGIYASHIRNRDKHLSKAVDEFFAIARAGGNRAQVSHLNVRHGTGAAPGAWRQAVQRLSDERSKGLDVLADMTPFPSGIGLATGLLPSWALATSPAATVTLLRDPEARRKIEADSDRYWRFVHAGEWERVTLASSPGSSHLEGLSFPRIAELTGKTEWDCYFDILVAAGENLHQVQLLGELFTDDHLAEAISNPLFLLGVDAYTSRKDGPLEARTRHPLFFHGHTHYLSHHVLRNNVLTFAEAVHKMTKMVADHFQLTGRGEIREGMHADIAVFDPGMLRSTNTFALPETYSTAARYVFVNGIITVDDGRHTHALSGRLLPRH